MLALFRALPLAWQIGIVAAWLAAAAGTYSIWHHKVYQSGYTAAINKIAAHDKEAVDAATAARARRNDCIARDGVFDIPNWKCDR